ncbi:MAG: arylsulfotransferase family protein [Solirubrobacterales bacterium]
MIRPVVGCAAGRAIATAIAALAVGGSTATPAAANVAPRGQANFSIAGLFPRYGPYVHDYVVRCDNAPVRVNAHVSDSWRMSIGGGAARAGDFSATVPLSAGMAFTITVRNEGGGQPARYHVRCLPRDFPTYTFTRSAPVSPDYFAADTGFAPVKNRYAMIFNRHGVPIWWYGAPVVGPRVLPSGNILWFLSNGESSRYEIRGLDGNLVRSLSTASGGSVDTHDLQRLGNRSYLIGAHTREHHVDTSLFGGPSDANVRGAELQEVGPRGELLWDWRSEDHISLAETGRWWQWVIEHRTADGYYDPVHWNSIEPHGSSVIASFRHLDAVYRIRKSNGSIVWKLGGMTTPQSLEVQGDPKAYTFGGQHDARLVPDGTLSVFDNRTGLHDPAPRAVRYRIDPGAGTATLVQSISDPAIGTSYRCGSARLLPNQDWLIDWGQNSRQGAGSIGGYKPNGERTFLLTFDSTFSYRAQPVPGGALTAQDLRHGMDAMAAP